MGNVKIFELIVA